MEEVQCKVRGCTNPIGGTGTKCGDLCHVHWAEKSSSSLRRIIDDPEKQGGGPEPGDPTIEEIRAMTAEIRASKIKHRGKDQAPSDPKTYRLHLPDGMTLKDIDWDE